MSVVRTHGNFVVRPSLAPPPHLFLHQHTNYTYHVRASSEMFGLVKGAVRFARHLAQMRKVNAGSKLVDHGEQVIICPRSVGSNAEREAVGRRVAAAENV